MSFRHSLNRDLPFFLSKHFYFHNNSSIDPQSSCSLGEYISSRKKRTHPLTPKREKSDSAPRNVPDFPTFSNRVWDYHGDVQCPPGKGMGCVPTTEILDMIVEKQTKTKDLFDRGKHDFDPSKRYSRQKNLEDFL